MPKAEKAIKIRTSLFWIPLPFLDEILTSGDKFELMPSLEKSWLDFLADGELLKHSVRVESKSSVTVLKTKKTTDMDKASEFVGEPVAIITSEHYLEDEINVANIMFAQTLLKKIVGYSKKIKWI